MVAPVIALFAVTFVANCFGLTANVVAVPVDASVSVASSIKPFVVVLASATDIVPSDATLMFVPTITPPSVVVVAGGNNQSA